MVLMRNTLDKNVCNLCNLKLLSRDDLWEHVETKHEEYFKGILEVAAANRARSNGVAIVSHRPMVWPDRLCTKLIFSSVLTIQS